MKKGWKIFLVTDLAILAVGIGLTLIGVAMGDRPDGTAWNRFWNRISHQEFHIQTGEDMKELEFDAIDITCKAGNISIEGECAGAAMVNSNGLNTGLKVEERDGLAVLVSESDDLSFGDIFIQVPKNKKLSYIDTSIGSGELDMENVDADKVSVKVSTGNANLYDVTSKDINLKCSMGDIEYEHSELTYQDFNYAIDCKTGNIELDDTDYSGLNMEKRIRNGADKNITISCKAGNVCIDLQDGVWEEETPEDSWKEEYHEDSEEEHL